MTGSEAIDQAIKLARGSTGRTEILHGDHGYHGVTGFALTMIGAADMREWAEPLIPDFRAVRHGDLESLREAIGERTAQWYLSRYERTDGRAPAATTSQRSGVSATSTAPSSLSTRS